MVAKEANGDQARSRACSQPKGPERPGAQMNSGAVDNALGRDPAVYDAAVCSWGGTSFCAKCREPATVGTRRCQRNAAFTIMLNESDRRCDQVTRTLFNGSVLGVDEWEASCRDRNAYSVSVLSELNEAIITSLSCHELSAISKMLLQMSGSRSKAARCRIKSTRRGLYRAVAFVP
jgi:hypothetical protein